MLKQIFIGASSTNQACEFDEDHAFLVIEIAGDTLRFQAVSRSRLTVGSEDTVRQAATTTP